jgi:4-amino-4-deoxy-L-arabinose transferase-like glycosyltransferase
MAKELFSLRIAMLSSAAFAFFPSLTLWSVAIGIDMTALLCISAYLFALIKALEKFNFPSFFIMAISLTALAPFRGYAVSALVVVTVFGIVYNALKRMTISKRLLLGLSAILIVILIIYSPLAPDMGHRLKENIDMVISRQGGFAAIDDGGYLIFPARCYEDFNCNLRDLVQAYARGMFYVLFSPFPWEIGSKLQLMAYPQTVLWYFMLPFIIFGFFIGYKKKRLRSLIIFLYCFLMFSVLAFVEGNIGGLFRHKDMATPFALIFFAAGFCELYDRLFAKGVRS